jgi:hypothetical protein
MSALLPSQGIADDLDECLPNSSRSERVAADCINSIPETGAAVKARHARRLRIILE